MNGVKVSTELQQQIMQMFKDKQDARAISKALGIHAETVLKYLKENGHDPRNRLGIDDEMIKKMYEEGKSAYEIQKIIGCKAVNSVYNRLRKITNMRDRAGFNNPNLKHGYFSDIDTETKAYFLGFFFADGTLYSRKKNSQNEIRLEIHEKDSRLLEILKEELGCDNEIQTVKKNCKRLSVHSDQLYTDLVRHGFSERKTWGATGFCFTGTNMDRHILRGFLDGDGWAYMQKYGPAIGWCGGNEASLADIRDHLTNTLDTYPLKITGAKKNTWTILYSSKKDVEALYHYLYDDATIYLSRKKYVLDNFYRAAC